MGLGRGLTAALAEGGEVLASPTPLGTLWPGGLRTQRGPHLYLLRTRAWVSEARLRSGQLLQAHMRPRARCRPTCAPGPLQAPLRLVRSRTQGRGPGGCVRAARAQAPAPKELPVGVPGSTPGEVFLGVEGITPEPPDIGPGPPL